jgi:hypothetical protein
VRSRCALVAIALVVTVTACVPTARGRGAYEAKAAATAEKMLSAVRTGELLATLAGRDRILPPYGAAAATGTEDEATAIQGTFDAIQPPDTASDRLRSELDELLNDATAAVETLRIAARRADFDAMAATRHDLHEVGDALERFETAHE